MQRQRFKNELHVFSVKNILALQMQRQLMKIIYVQYVTYYYSTDEDPSLRIDNKFTWFFPKA